MITAEHLTKRYGAFTAVNDLSFEIEDGRIYGFLGPNGAGKSTTMNMMTGCLSATEGRILIDGFDLFEEPEKAKKRIGYLPEQPPLYTNESPVEYLRFVARAKGLKGTELNEQIRQALERTGLQDVKNKRISSLSKGYRQRVGIAQALLGNPSVIILDEPTVGLDPIQIIGIRELIRELGQEHTVILSSHILSEVQNLCEKILIIANGNLVAFDDPEHLEARLLSPNEITLTAEGSGERVRSILDDVGGLSEPEIATDPKTGLTRVCLKLDSQENMYEISKKLFFAFAACQLPLLEVNLKKANLEDIFLELTEQTGSEAAPSETDAVPPSVEAPPCAEPEEKKQERDDV